MKFTVNGESRSTESAPTVAELVAEIVGTHEGVAVAVDGDVVAASAWENTRIAAGEEVDILTAVQGG